MRKNAFKSPTRFLTFYRQTDDHICNNTYFLNQKKYHNFLEKCGWGFFEWPDRFNHPTTMRWSHQLFELLGYEPQSFEPQTHDWMKIMHPEDFHVYSQNLQKILQGESLPPLEYRFFIHNNYRWIRLIHFHPEGSSQSPTSIMGLAEDVHEQRQIKEQLIADNLRLEQEVSGHLAKIKTTFETKNRHLANMNHELRTPLGLMIGFAELLAEKKLQGDTGQYANMIVKNGEILSRIVNDALDLSKAEAGHLYLIESPIHITQFLQEIHDSFALQARQKSVSLSIENYCPPEWQLLSDKIRLKQIIYNLVANAIKYTDQGSIKIKAEYDKKNNKFHLHIIDTGMGIPKQEQDKIFHEYIRSEMADALQTSGSGLGLRLAQGLAHAMGGHIQLITSSLGKGSHFRFTLHNPNFNSLKQETSTFTSLPTSTLHSSLSQLPQFKIFILDDNHDNVKLAEIFLRKIGCQAQGFVHSDIFLEQVRLHQPDLVLVDINMPQMNGFEIAQDLKKNTDFKGQIWALTAYALKDDIPEILENGFSAYVKKPMRLDSLRQKIARAMEARAIELQI